MQSGENQIAIHVEWFPPDYIMLLSNKTNFILLYHFMKTILFYGFHKMNLIVLLLFYKFIVLCSQVEISYSSHRMVST